MHSQLLLRASRTLTASTLALLLIAAAPPPLRAGDHGPAGGHAPAGTAAASGAHPTKPAGAGPQSPPAAATGTATHGVGPAAESPSGLTPSAAYTRLQQGNARFATGQVQHPGTDAAQRKQTATAGQKPFATILGCSDSRVPPERVFDAGVGELFVVRVAGNVADTDEIGTIEYGVGHLRTPVLVVLGHTSCGAVSAVASGALVDGDIPALVDNIKPAVEAARRTDPKLDGTALVSAAVRTNIYQSMEDVFRRSGEVRELVREGKLKVLGGVYDIASGKVEWLGIHPEQGRLLKYTGDCPDAPAARRPAEDSHAHARTDDHGPAYTGPTAEQGLTRLKEGNERFLAGRALNPDSGKARISETAKGQQPFASILACSDSRGPVERIFDQGLGDLFVVRVAGNVCDVDETGSLEYGIAHLQTPLLVVLGHTRCGAVTAVATDAHVHGCIPALVDNIKPAVDSLRAEQPDLSGDAFLAEAIKANVFQSIRDLLTFSGTARARARSGKVTIIGAIYDIETGRVEWLGPHPQQEQILAGRLSETPAPAAHE